MWTHVVQITIPITFRNVFRNVILVHVNTAIVIIPAFFLAKFEFNNVFLLESMVNFNSVYAISKASKLNHPIWMEWHGKFSYLIASVILSPSNPAIPLSLGHYLACLGGYNFLTPWRCPQRGQMSLQWWLKLLIMLIKVYIVLCAT